MVRKYRRMGGSSNLSARGNYARTMGFTPVPYRGKRKGGAAPLRTGRRVRPRMAASYTVTKTKQKRRTGGVNKQSDNQSSSKNSIGKKWLSKFEKLLAKKVVSPQTVFSNATGNISSTQGKQGVNFFTFMPKATLTALETAANGGTSTNVPVKLFLKGGKTTLRLRNTVNTTCWLMLYDIVTKKAPPDTTLDTPQECWAKGLSDYGSATGTTTVGQTPFRSPEFNMYFAVNKVTRVSLEPGQQHDHVVYHKYNRVLDSIRFQNSVSTSIPGITRFTMVVWHGSLGHESATPTTVTYMPITLDYASSVEYTYGWIEKTAKAFTLTDNNPTTVATFNFMSENQDVDGTMVTA